MDQLNSKNLVELLTAQFVAESYVDSDRLTLEDLFRLGNNNPEVQGFRDRPRAADLPGKTRMTDVQVTRFNQTYDIVDHLPNTWSGFSGTLLRNKLTGDYVLSFRSTEYQNENAGGDWGRDGLVTGANGTIGGADNEIGFYGFAVAQIADAEGYFRQLRSSGLPPAGANRRG